MENDNGSDDNNKKKKVLPLYTYDFNRDALSNDVSGNAFASKISNLHDDKRGLLYAIPNAKSISIYRIAPTYISCRAYRVSKNERSHSVTRDSLITFR